MKKNNFTSSFNIDFWFDDNKYFTNDTVSLCVSWYLLQSANQRDTNANAEQLINSKGYHLKYLLGLINSKLLNFYFKKILSSNLHVYPEAIRNLPIYTANNTEQEVIIKRVDRILEINQELISTSEKTDKHEALKREIEKIDHQIDEQVYKLYGLTDEEIKTIEE